MKLPREVGIRFYLDLIPSCKAGEVY